VIITTKNEEKNIENCLQSIKSQTFRNIELIIVDNFSEDKTVERAQKYDAKVFFKGNERSVQRNYGAKVATGKYLIYLDADMILSQRILEECVLKCEQQSFDALYIPERIFGDSFWIKVRDFERSFYVGTVIDAVRFVRKELFLFVKGFDESLTGPEDWDFDRKIRMAGKIGVIHATIYHNEGAFNVKKYLRKKSYYSRGIQLYAQKWGQRDPEVLKQIGVRYRLVDVFIEQGKWKKLLRNPVYAIAMYYLRFRVAVSYLNTR
jgi:glycosyltransferase involved in cell wall biosynthesis